METTNMLIGLEQQSSEIATQVQDETNKQKIKVATDDLKMPTANETFKARVTCQRRS